MQVGNMREIKLPVTFVVLLLLFLLFGIVLGALMTAPLENRNECDLLLEYENNRGTSFSIKGNQCFLLELGCENKIGGEWVEVTHSDGSQSLICTVRVK